MRPLNIFSCITIVLLLSPARPAFGQLNEWRGPGRSGIYNESGLLKSWPESGPQLLWEASGHGSGYSSVTVTSDAVYITGIHDGKDF